MIKQYFPGILRDMGLIVCGLASHFQVTKALIYDDDMVAKMEFLQQHEDDLTREDIGKLWTDTSIKYEHSILSIKALSFIQFPLTYCSEVGFSSMVSIKTMYQTGLRLIMVCDVFFAALSQTLLSISCLLFFEISMTRV